MTPFFRTLPAAFARTFLLAWALLLPAAARAQAAAPAGVSIEILWSGVVGDPDTSRERPDPKAVDRVPARVGVEFGFMYILHGVPDGTQVKVRQVARYPQPGRRNPQSRVMQKTEEADAECTAGEPCATSYTIEAGDEIIPGEWRLEVQYRGRKIGERRFLMRYEGV